MAKINKIKKLTIGLSVLIILLSIPTFIYIYFIGRIYPNVYIAGVNLSGKTQNEALNAIESKVNIPENLTLKYDGGILQIPTKSLNIKLDKDKTVKRAIQLGRSGNPLFDITQIFNSLKNKTNYPIELNFDKNNLQKTIDDLATQIDIEPQNAKFSITNGRVQNFSEGNNGLKVNKQKIIEDLANEINKNSTNKIVINVQRNVVLPEIKTSDVNNLGIKELIGSGTSHFAGSISSRVYNINLAASRINGTIIAPGETFSFDKTVGDISALSGYKQAYVIQNGQTILGDGGGVCQVSTTMFRAAINTGLPIVERHAHAYRVHYYEEDAAPGFDATIYTPTVDFKFKNDTENSILIQTQIDLRNLILTFNFYGTNDGRKVEITKPILSGYQPAPPDLYTDDPTLPVGQVKQIDFAASALKSQFDYKVTKNGEIINQQTFFSNFKPWQAKFLRGTKV